MPRPRSTLDRLARLESALDHASDYASWLEVAAELDTLTGAAAWREADAPDVYDARLLRRETDELVRRRRAGDALGLVDAVESTLLRHLADLAAPELYAVSLCGTQHTVHRWRDEVEAALEWLLDAPVPGIDDRAKLARFQQAARIHGRSALVLSGGATWGFHHLGVVRCLFENGLLPDILSGASTGAMIAAGVCTRTEAELADMFENTDQIRLDGLLPVGWRQAVRNKAWLDPAQLDSVLKNNVGVHTFAEAHARTGRVLNISVAPMRTRQKPRLLSQLTSPDVLVHSAALASSALPGLFPPVVLQARTRDGSTAPYLPSERWADGSLYADLPKLRLARLYNVNHFILSQTNPHALPVAQLTARRGVLPTLAGVASSAARAQGGFAVDLLDRVTRRGTGPVRMATERMRALVGQPYRGDIDIHPRFRMELLRKVAVNPTRTDLATFIREGRRATWPLLPRIDDQTRIERVFQRCVRTLQSRLGNSP